MIIFFHVLKLIVTFYVHVMPDDVYLAFTNAGHNVDIDIQIRLNKDSYEHEIYGQMISLFSLGCIPTCTLDIDIRAMNTGIYITLFY